jgi:hypothetical protein
MTLSNASLKEGRWSRVAIITETSGEMRRAFIHFEISLGPLRSP